MKMTLGFKFARFEHIWERRTNYALLSGITLVSAMYYINLKMMSLPYMVETALFFLGLSCFCHLLARIGHLGEQKLLKKFRPWRNNVVNEER
jgi:hypothetical protein